MVAIWADGLVTALSHWAFLFEVFFLASQSPTYKMITFPIHDTTPDTYSLPILLTATRTHVGVFEFGNISGCEEIYLFVRIKNAKNPKPVERERESTWQESKEESSPCSHCMRSTQPRDPHLPSPSLPTHYFPSPCLVYI